jgi:2-polyprenyl-3-methyl-5-hydroxy-6-metoxy-1,4-benzoquinol methylase
MTVLEPGCAMGFFSLPLARMVGPAGRVVCVDLQATMIDGLLRRAKQAGVDDRLVPICGTLDDPRLEPYLGRVDFAAAIYMVHEVPDAAAFLRRLRELLRPGARLLVIEPRWHVPAEAFERTVERAREAGLVELDRPLGKKSRSALFERPGEGAP